MKVIANQVPEIGIIGRACRLPGAASVSEFWSLLAQGRCAVSSIPADRWCKDQFWHPGRGEPGKSYTWSAGVLDDIWGFDPSVFGISPREAEQIDPQQRLGLELVWEALEDAQIPPSSLAGEKVGVFFGASSLDYGNTRLFDVAAGDAHFATGNTLSLISNRISYAFDLRGPSMTIDTACSSSLVALHQAVSAIQQGHITTAIVGGVNILASPFGFISFARASMLSPSGLCRAFDATADGYVRAEGGVVLVIRSLSQAQQMRNKLHGVVLGTGVNSDGRTVGVSMPSETAQADLLTQTYQAAGVHPDRLAFIEAHGTGTRVGDPVEARAIGKALGQRRSRMLPIGSAKTNIGHLEPASGLVGVLKAMLALEHNHLPATLHCGEPNPDISFADLNLELARNSQDLPTGSAWPCAGINSFGFGGTNAHAIIALPPRSKMGESKDIIPPPLLMISAASKQALCSMAGLYADLFESAMDEDIPAITTAAVHNRERLDHRLAMKSESRVPMVERLRAIAGGSIDVSDCELGTAVGRSLPIAFVYSGNGSQWAGMGQAAYRNDANFRQRFDAIDQLFAGLADWSLSEALFADDIERKLSLTSIAQPLIFAIQSATTTVLRSRGLNPSYVLGHSVGEIAAAEAAGILGLEDAVRVIFFRSLHQELAHHRGSMAVILSPDCEKIASAAEGVEIAAFNSPKAVTVSGSQEAIRRLAAFAEAENARVHTLDLDYPFHSKLMDVVRQPLLDDLADLSPRKANTAFISTVTGVAATGPELDGGYWWRNVREPVRFSQAVQQAGESGAAIFMEIGPRSTLVSHISDSLKPLSGQFATVGVFQRNDQSADQISRAVARALVRGAAVDSDFTMRSGPQRATMLPSYPWQRTAFRLGYSQEAIRYTNPVVWHPLIGARLTTDALEWHGHVSTGQLSFLNDHEIRGQILMPGAAFLEMAFAIAQEWLGGPIGTVTEFQIVQPMILAPAGTREVKSRLSAASGVIEIFSRPRLTSAQWQLHAIGKIISKPASLAGIQMPRGREGEKISGAELYEIARAAGLHFGEAFRQVGSVTRISESMLVVDLIDTATGPEFGIDPARLDSCFHGLIALFGRAASSGPVRPYLPIRFGEASLLQAGTSPVRAIIHVRRCDEKTIVADFILLDNADCLVAHLQEARFVSTSATRSSLSQSAIVTSIVPMEVSRPCASSLKFESVEMILNDALAGLTAQWRQSEGPLLFDGWAVAVAHEIIGATCLSGSLEARPLGARLGDAQFARLCSILEGSGLAAHDANVWTLSPDAALPPSSNIFQTLVAECPECSIELLIAGRLTQVGAGLRSKLELSESIALSDAQMDAYGRSAAFVQQASLLLQQICSSLLAESIRQKPIRILQLGHDRLTQPLAELVAKNGALLTVAEPDRRVASQSSSAPNEEVPIRITEDVSALPNGKFDLIVSAAGLWRNSSILTSGALSEKLADNGIFVAIEPAPSSFRKLVRCFAEQSNPNSNCASQAHTGSLLTAREWQDELAGAGFERYRIENIKLAGEGGVVILATAQVGADSRSLVRRMTEPRRFVIVTNKAGAWCAALSSRLAANLRIVGDDVSIEPTNGPHDADPVPGADHIIHIDPCQDSEGCEAATLRNRCLDIKRIVDRCAGSRTTMWIVTSGANVSRGQTKPVETGVWAFARTLGNERPSLSVRCIDVLPTAAAEDAADWIRDIISSGTAETEIVVDEHGPAVVRLVHLQDAVKAEVDRQQPMSVRLIRTGSGFDRLVWGVFDRMTPGPNEIEIAVEATGLNFRDVMVAMGLLPEDVIEDGFAGAALGLECAGRVSAVGKKVDTFKVGDRVLTFAASSFATHVTAPEDLAVAIPDGITTEAAATIPVAFATAYYALVELARIRRGDWILLHGGAGGVGLAAWQIARWKGAKVIATAGSDEKRDFLKSLGVDHVLDSRSLAFADDTMRITKTGVDIVVNSLAGEAMERSLAVLKPFGRFIELGKRDYVANTHIGVRPFRKNISYFGVDLDQLLRQEPRKSRKLLNNVIKLFANGVLTPLPFRTFSAPEVRDAFRLMQQSGHIGKLIVTPSSENAVARRKQQEFIANSERTHLITGGFGGFGLEAMRWLAEHGACHFAVISRTGPSTPEAHALLSEFQQGGITLRAFQCDVADRGGLSTVVGQIESEMPPIGGVLHAAMVLDDGILSDLDVERFDKVLSPKVTGAVHLDALTRNHPVDYFVLFSSATTHVGNPGQSNYVAANGFLEGLAAARQTQGLPALAIAWGAISDVGVLARNRKVADRLTGRMGIMALSSREALDLMGEALARVAVERKPPVLTIALVDWSAARERLPVLNSPTFGLLMQGSSNRSSRDGQLDIAALVASEGVEAASQKINSIIVEEVSRVLRMAKEDVSLTRPLADIGLDSLLAIELAMNLESRFRLEGQLSATATGLTIAELTKLVLATTESVGSDLIIQALITRHLDEVVDEHAIESATELAVSERSESEGGSK